MSEKAPEGCDKKRLGNTAVIHLWFFLKQIFCCCCELLAGPVITSCIIPNIMVHICYNTYVMLIRT